LALAEIKDISLAPLGKQKNVLNGLAIEMPVLRQVAITALLLRSLLRKVFRFAACCATSARNCYSLAIALKAAGADAVLMILKAFTFYSRRRCCLSMV
jgi:S-adenosylhomocysteine hydrolase